MVIRLATNVSKNAGLKESHMLTRIDHRPHHPASASPNPPSRSQNTLPPQ